MKKRLFVQYVHVSEFDDGSFLVECSDHVVTCEPQDFGAAVKQVVEAAREEEKQMQEEARLIALGDTND